MMRVTVHDSPARAAEEVARTLCIECQSRGRSLLALPTGQTPLPLYEALIQNGNLPAGRLHCFQLDELVGLPPEHAARFDATLERVFFSRLAVRPQVTPFMIGSAADACARYESAIEELGGFDCAILGLGPNGHIAFVEPAAQLEPSAHEVVLQDETRQALSPLFGGLLTKVPTRGVTLGPKALIRSRKIVLMAFGAAKKAAVRKMLEGPVTTWFPASLLKLHSNVEIHLDSESAP